MQSFQLELWHLIAMFCTILVGFFKTDISNAIQSCFIILSKRFQEGQKVQVLSCTGEWKDITILKYTLSIPFIKKGGGVLIRYDNPNGTVYQEGISFGTWKTLRIRTKAT